MARLARVVAPGLPHLVTQRGNRGEQTFFCDEDYQSYLELLRHWCGVCKVKIWAYCLMPNHVHLIAVPQSADGLGCAFGEAHRRYTRLVNTREGWRGHLWQGRFTSCVLDKPYTLTAARYVEVNPVRARLTDAPGQYRWSSAKAHLRGRDDALVRVAPLLKRVPNWRAFLGRAISKEDMNLLRVNGRTGRPMGEEAFVVSLEQELGRTLRRRKSGPKPRPAATARVPKPGSKSRPAGTVGVSKSGRKKPGPKKRPRR